MEKGKLKDARRVCDSQRERKDLQRSAFSQNRIAKPPTHPGLQLSCDLHTVEDFGVTHSLRLFLLFLFQRGASYPSLLHCLPTIWRD